MINKVGEIQSHKVSFFVRFGSQTLATHSPDIALCSVYRAHGLLVARSHLRQNRTLAVGTSALFLTTVYHWRRKY